MSAKIIDLNGIPHILSVTREVTEMKEAKNKIAKSLAEKEVLLKEVHHRVKNNMAVISSLLSLQADYVEDEKYLDILKESQSRIKSMALVHEMLYQQEEFSSIDVMDYIKSLSESIKRTFSTNPKISLEIDVEKLQLEIDLLIPCGLIINELLTNSFKYAFDNQEDPTIKIFLKKTGINNIMLKISDNGIGLPADYDLEENQGLGFKLVQLLVNQMRGSLEITSSSGTEYTLNCPLG